MVLLLALLVAPAHLTVSGFVPGNVDLYVPTYYVYHRIQQFHHGDALVCYRIRMKFSDILLGTLCVCALHVRPRSRIISRLSISRARARTLYYWQPSW